MAVHKTRRGLDLPLAGAPRQSVEPARPVSQIALVLRDYVGIRPRVLVQLGQRVALGQPLVEDRRSPGAALVAMGSGRVAAIHRGPGRALLSVVIELAEDAGSREEPGRFGAFRADAGERRETTIALLLEAGLWTALRMRPFGRVPTPETVPHSIFVTAMDTHPLSPRPEVVLAGREEDFQRGLAVLCRLTDGPVYLCRQVGSALGPGNSGARVEEFAGKHPAGTVGYHIHVLDPVHRGKVVFHTGYQDVARIGRLFATGRLDPACVISLAGPLVRDPRLLRTRLGASTDELVAGEIGPGEARVVSGSVLHGDRASAEQAFLGRYHNQISVLAEGRERELLGWLAPGTDKFSALPTFVSRLSTGRRFALSTSTHGSRRAMVPIGLYEQVMPMDLMPSHLLRALTVGDAEWAEELGALELDEEDLGLCTFVCPGKLDYGPALRRALTTLEQEG